MPETTIKHTYQLKRGEEFTLQRVNPLLRNGEPVVVYCKDGSTNLKIGDGIHKYNDLPFITSQDVNSVIPDWNINDINSPSYIKNRPMYASIEEVNYTRLPYKSNPACEVMPGPEGSGYVMVKGKKLGLVEGEMYQVECYEYFTDEGIRLENSVHFVETDSLVTSEGDYLTYAENIIPPVGTLWLTDWHYVDIFDGVIFNDDGELVEGEGYVYFVGGATHSFGNIETIIYNIPSIDYVYHKIDGNLLPTSQFFEGDSLLPQSGQAVAAAMQTAINRSSPNISKTLGDGHIKSQYDSKYLKTYLYTEGIGLNADLKTSHQETIVGAVNEVNEHIEKTITNIKGDNLVTYYDSRNLNIYKLSNEDLGDEPLSAKYNFESSNQYLSYVSPVHDGYIQVQCSRSSKYIYVYHYSNIDNSKKQLFYLTPSLIPDDLWNVLKSSSSMAYCVALQNIENNTFVINLITRASTNSDFIQWNIKQEQVTSCDAKFRNPYLGSNIDSSNTYYSEYCLEGGFGVTRTLYKLTVGSDGFIVKEDVPLKFAIDANANLWSCFVNSIVTDDNKTYYVWKYTSENNILNTNKLTDEAGNILTECFTNVCNYNNYIAVIKAKSKSSYVLCLFDTSTNSLVTEIPIKSSTYEFSKLIIINDTIYIIGTYYSYGGKIENSEICLNSKYNKNRFSLGFDTYKLCDNQILAINLLASFWIPLKKELAFNETDTDQTFNPESTLPQSGKAVAEAIKEVNGIKYITEPVLAQNLDYGTYIIDGGQVECSPLEELGKPSSLYNGVITVSPIEDWAKLISISSLDENHYSLYYAQFVFDLGAENYDLSLSKLYVDKKYVDEQIAALQAQINAITTTQTEIVEDYEEASELLGGTE